MKEYRVKGSQIDIKGKRLLVYGKQEVGKTTLLDLAQEKGYKIGVGELQDLVLDNKKVMIKPIPSYCVLGVQDIIRSRALRGVLKKIPVSTLSMVKDMKAGGKLLKKPGVLTHIVHLSRSPHVRVAFKMEREFGTEWFRGVFLKKPAARVLRLLDDKVAYLNIFLAKDWKKDEPKVLLDALVRKMRE